MNFTKVFSFLSLRVVRRLDSVLTGLYKRVSPNDIYFEGYFISLIFAVSIVLFGILFGKHNDFLIWLLCFLLFALASRVVVFLTKDVEMDSGEVVSNE